MKKTISVILAIMILLSVAGCGEKETLLSKDDPVTLNLWHVYGEQADSPMNRLVEEFNKTEGLERGVVVKVTNVTSTSRISSQLIDSAEKKPGSLEMPDIFSCHTNTAVSIGADNLVDWNGFFTKEELSDYVPEFISDGTLDGKFCVFPVSKSTYTLYVNGTGFEKFSQNTGVTYDDLATWEGFFDAAEKYYNYSGGQPFCALDYLIRHVELDVMAKGDELTYTEDGWYDFTDPSLKESWMQFAKALVSGHIIVSDLYANTQMMTGEVLAGIGSSAAITYFNDTVTYPDNTTENMDLHVLALPKTGMGSEYMPQTGVGLAAYKTDDKKAEAAYVFIKWFTQAKTNLDFVASTGYMPSNNAAYDSISEYEFINEGYKRLYEAIHTMSESYVPVVRPAYDGYYDKVNVLYAYFRENRGEFVNRINKGESVETLAEETWSFFAGIK
ncbi:MAG: extracellular solute-binding protein [Eubacteriaceae bacterium]|nr:extracellular solute-binding protein [Eubacteriaceae bacterium]